MNADELIDDVARQMTTPQVRPALRTRVMATIGDARQERTHGWLVPIAASATVAALALAWFMLPAPPVAEVTPVAQQAPAIATTPAVVEEPVSVAGARATPVPSPAQQAAVAAPVAINAWMDEPPVDFPALPPLPGPPSIVIEPIVWDEVTIAPIAVTLIELQALSIEPLAPAGNNGV